MSSSLLKSLLSNWIGLGLAVLIGLFISPFVVHSLGPEDYGLWTFIISITSQFVILDLGARNAVVMFTAKYRHEGNSRRLSEILSSGSFFFVGAGLLALILMSALIPFLGELMKVSPQRISLIQIIYLIAALDTSIEVALGIYDAMLAGSERYDLINSLNVSRLFLNALALWIVLSAGSGILGIALATLSLRLAQRLATRFFALRLNSGLTLKLSSITRTDLVQISRYGFWASIIQASNRLIHKVDTIVAGVFIGASAVTSYAIPLILIDQFRMLAETGNTILMPRFSQLSAAGDSQTTKILLLRWSRYSFMLALAVGAPLLMTGRDFIILWMGPKFPEALPVLILLSLPFFLTLPALVFSYYLYATNRHALNAKLLAAEALSNLILSIILVQFFGLRGIAFATLVPALIFRGILLPLQAASLGVVSFVEYVRFSILACLPLAIFQFSSLYALNLLIGASNWFSFFANNALGLLAFAAASSIFYLGNDERAYLARRLGIRTN